MRTRKRKSKERYLLAFPFWDIVELLPVYPLANVVTNYTSHNRNNKRKYVTHEFHLLPDGRSRRLILS
jgi:hypothetical protein